MVKDIGLITQIVFFGFSLSLLSILFREFQVTWNSKIPRITERSPRTQRTFCEVFLRKENHQNLVPINNNFDKALQTNHKQTKTQ